MPLWRNGIRARLKLEFLSVRIRLKVHRYIMQIKHVILFLATLFASNVDNISSRVQKVDLNVKSNLALYNKVAAKTVEKYLGGLYALKEHDYSNAASHFMHSYFDNIDNHLGEKSYVMYLYCLSHIGEYDAFEMRLVDFKSEFPNSKDIEFLDFLRVNMLTNSGSFYYDRQIESLLVCADNVENFLLKYQDSNSIYKQHIIRKYKNLRNDIFQYQAFIANELLSKNVVAAAIRYERIIHVFPDQNLEPIIVSAIHSFLHANVHYKAKFYFDLLKERYPESQYIHKLLPEMQGALYVFDKEMHARVPFEVYKPVR